MNSAHEDWREAHALNVAAAALGLGLAGMTQARWNALSAIEQQALRDLSGLTKPLVAYEGDRVEVVRMDGSKARFWVGRSSGWCPCHLEVKKSNSSGGTPADKEYRSIKLIKAKDRRYA